MQVFKNLGLYYSYVQLYLIMKIKETVAVILYNKERKILLHLRDNKKGIYMPGMWALFGGGVKSGESSYDAARREINEEIGYNLKKLKLFKEYCLDDRQISVFYSPIPFIDESRIQLKEGRDAKLFSPKEIKELYSEGKTNYIIMNIINHFIKQVYKNK